MEKFSIRIADKNDIDLLTEFRFKYLTDAEGELTGEQSKALREQLPGYFDRHIGQDFTAYLAEYGGKPAGVIFMVRLEKPANVHFLNGRTCYLMNVYTNSEYRRMGAASMILERLIADARAEGITCIDLSATEMGRPLYLKHGFAPRGNTEMRLEL